jgi:hypothetical protein
VHQLDVWLQERLYDAHHSGYVDAGVPGSVAETRHRDAGQPGSFSSSLVCLLACLLSFWVSLFIL